MAGARLGFLAGPPALMRGCLQLKAALTRLNTNLVSQRGALAALRDEPFRRGAEAAIRANLAHLEQTLAGIDGVALAVAPQRGLACAVELDDDGPTAQELMVALFARRVAVYPGDGLGEQRASTTLRLNLSGPRWAMDHLRAVLGEAIDEAASGRWREPVAELLDGKGTDRAAGLAARVRRGR
jgi:aspartate/methionine/tyrosine aminotransferase